MTVTEFPKSPLRVINVGLERFAEDLKKHDVSVIQVDWSPPVGGEFQVGGIATEALEIIDKANAEALERILAAQPILADVKAAGDVIDGLDEGVILHAGPPITWERMCGPMRGAVAGAIVLEGWAPDLASAERMAAAGDISFYPNHHFDAVGPMTGITTRSQPVLVVENRTFGNRACCTLNEGLGKVMRFGGNDSEVLARLRWLADTLGPALSTALLRRGGLDLKNIVARGLAMGDEMHQRNVACSSLLMRDMAPVLAEAMGSDTSLSSIFDFIGSNDQFFLNIAMAMGKAIMDPVRGIESCSIVTAMSRNGTDFGVWVSGTGDTWFTAPANMPDGLYFPGFTVANANPDMGDSTIIETVGLGGFAMAASPAVAGFVGAGTASEAVNYTLDMYEITVGENPDWTMPALDFRGIPTGIDIRLVIETGIPPTINTGIAHREPGVGQVGAGIVRAPMACFEQAVVGLADSLGPS